MRPLPEFWRSWASTWRTFKTCEPALREQLAGLWNNRQGVSAMKFAAALGAELTRLGPLGGEGAAVTRPELVPVLAAAPEVHETEMPSYLQTPAPRMQSGAVAPSSPAIAPPVAPPPMVRAEPASASRLAGTANMDLSAVVAAVQQGAIPFARSQPSAASLAEATERRQPATETPARGVGTGTIQTDLSAIVAAVGRASLPFGDSEPARPAEAHEGREEADFALLPLETYASVSGALARGEPREEALARHGVTAEVFERLTRAWSQRFPREPHLLARFKDLARGNTASGRRGE